MSARARLSTGFLLATLAIMSGACSPLAALDGAASAASGAPLPDGAGGAGAGGNDLGGGGEAGSVASPIAWSKRVGGDGEDRALGMAVDSLGGIVAVGQFSDSIDLGGGPASALGASDGFLVWFDKAGSFRHGLTLGGTGADVLAAAAVDASGTIMMTGSFENEGSFGGLPLTSVGGRDVVVGRYDDNGNMMWDLSFGSEADDAGLAVGYDIACNIIVTGRFRGSMTVGTELLESTGDDDVFVAKFDQYGAFLWAKRFGGAAPDVGLAIAVTLTSNIIVTGSGDVPSPAPREGPIFVMELDPDGNVLWNHHFGAAGNDGAASAVALGYAGKIAVAGAFAGRGTFGSQVLTSAGGSDAFTVVLDKHGELLWAKSWGDEADQDATGIGFDQDHSMTLAGSFTGTLDFGDGWAMASDGAASDAFVATLDLSGKPLRLMSFRGPGTQRALAGTVAWSGQTIVLGELSGSAQFGDDVLDAVGVADGFLASIAPIPR